MLVRIISAAVGIIIGVSILFFDNLYAYLSILSIIGAIGVWEIIRAVKCEKHRLLCGVCFFFGLLMPFFQHVDVLKKYQFIFYPVLIFTLLLIMLFGHKKITFENVAVCGAGTFVIPTAINCVISLRYMFDDIPKSTGVCLVLYLLFCAWFGDSGAYFVGTFLGKHKLCPEISPKKTVEGLVGGIVTVGLVTTIECLIYNNCFAAERFQFSYAVLIPIGMAASGFGVLGDLSASVIKRQYNVKDFGNLMPGHGGVLDRFDSVLFVAPFLCIFFKLISPFVQ